MSLRRRVSFVAAAAVAIAIFLAAGVCYWVVRDQLLGQVDSALHDQAELVLASGNFGLGSPFPGLPANAGGRAPYSQVVGIDGSVLENDGGLNLPITQTTRGVAASPSASVLQSTYVGNSHLRLYTFHDVAADGAVPVAVELARPLGPSDHILSKLRLVLLFLCAGGIALAFMLGRVAARRVLAPLAEVTQAAEIIGKTDDLSRRIGVHADDEVGQLATRFNAMLERLEGSRAELDESVRAQRQLVADASHELRTPVTSLRTNIEVLLAGADLDDEERKRLLTDVVEQSEELSSLVGDLIDLARGDLPADAAEDTRLDRIVGESVSRSRRNSPNITFDARLEPVIVDGIPERLGRAVNNLLDNAARHSPRRRDRRGPGRPPRGRGARPRRGDPRAGPAPRVRSLLPRRQHAGQAGKRAGPGHRAPGGRAARRLGQCGQRSRRRRDLHPLAPHLARGPGHEHGEQPAGAESPEPVRAQ